MTKEETKELKSTRGKSHGYTRKRADGELCGLGDECHQPRSSGTRYSMIFLNRRPTKPQWICGNCARKLRVI